MFWNLIIFQYRSESPQVKQNLITSVTCLVYGLPLYFYQILQKCLEVIQNVKKIEFQRRLDCVMTRNLFSQKTPDKTIGTKQRNWTGQEKFDI